jgi:hypothetical protein
MTLSNAALQKSLSPVFNQTAAATYAAFPEKLHDLVLLLTSSDEPVFIAPAIADHLSNNAAAVKAVVEDITKALRDHNAAGVSNYSYPIADSRIKLIAINEEIRGIFSAGFTMEMMGSVALDHELGHLVVKNGGMETGKHLAECAADAFAALRHVQRFGPDTDFFEAFNRTHPIVFGISPIHYTDKVVENVSKLIQTTDISDFSLQETAELAGKVALASCLDSDTLDKITAAFRPVAERCTKQLGNPRNMIDKLYQEDPKALDLYCREVLTVMKTHINDADICVVGSRFLSHPSRKRFMSEQAKTEPYWQAALEFITHNNNIPQSPAKAGKPTIF